MFCLITYLFLKEGSLLFLIYLLLSWFYTILFYFYFYQFHQEKSMTHPKRIISLHNLLGCICFLILLCLQHTSTTDILLILMGFSLSIIDIYQYIVDPFLSLLFFTSLLISQIPHIQIVLPMMVLLILRLISYLLPNQLGFGDVKLLVMWATCLSSLQLIWLIFIASSLGILFILFMNLLSSKRIEKIAFVPFLTTALTVVIYLF